MKLKLIYRGCWKFVKNCRIHIWISGALFFLALAVGLIYPVLFADVIEKLIGEIVKKTEGMNFFQLLLFIFKNNASTAFFVIVLGIFFGVIPLMLGVFNGYVLGFVMNKSAEIGGAGVLLRILPHGIFELPALILSLGLGLKIGWFMFEKGNKLKRISYNFKNSIKVFIFVIVPLLIVAALIETGLIFLMGG